VTFFNEEKTVNLQKICIEMTTGKPNPILLLAILFSLSSTIDGQPWEFIKEKDGIKIYTRTQPGSGLKSFKGVADINTPIAKAYNLIGNIQNTDWWDKNVKEKKILLYEKEKHAQYYIVYDSPWPVADRDLCADAKITTDPVTGVRTVYAVPLLDVIPDYPDYVRIKNYWQKWTVEPKGKNMIHVTLEGFVDPGGSVPDWVYNMVITSTPLKVIGNIKILLESK
jgi:hypothetical protein